MGHKYLFFYFSFPGEQSEKIQRFEVIGIKFYLMSGAQIKIYARVFIELVSHGINHIQRVV